MCTALHTVARAWYGLIPCAEQPNGKRLPISTVTHIHSRRQNSSFGQRHMHSAAAVPPWVSAAETSQPRRCMQRSSPGKPCFCKDPAGLTFQTRPPTASAMPS